MSVPGRELDVVVIGAGQAGLSTAWALQRQGFERDSFVVLDADDAPGGAWQHRWPSLTLSTANAIHDLPGMPMSEAVDTSDGEVRAAEAVPRYFGAYARRFALPILRPVTVQAVRPHGERLRVETDRQTLSARGLINATGTWDTPNLPRYPGADRFRGRQLHSRDYRSPQEFAGRHVVIVGAGISALQHLDEISRVTTTTWVSRRKPQFTRKPFTPEDGRAAVALVEKRVRRGLKPGSVVSVTGLPWTPALSAAEQRGALTWHPMFSEMTETGIRWPDGTEQQADVILWATGFQHTLDHLAPLGLEEEGGGITMTGRLATQVAKDPRIHLVGYGPSASTIGANRAGGAAARELMAHLGPA